MYYLIQSSQSVSKVGSIIFFHFLSEEMEAQRMYLAHLGDYNVQSRAALWTWVSLTPKSFLQIPLNFRENREQSFDTDESMRGDLGDFSGPRNLCRLTHQRLPGCDSIWFNPPNYIMKKILISSYKLLQVMGYWGCSWIKKTTNIKF